MLKQILSAIKIVSLATILSFGLSYVYAWTSPTANPPAGNVDAPINVGTDPQEKVGNLTVGNLTTAGKVTTGTLRVTTGAGASKVLTSDASGNATWQAASGGTGVVNPSVAATKDDAGAIASGSGFFQSSAPVNYYAGASSWQHLIESRHTNDANNYALQIAGSFFDQNLYFRKTANSATTAWNRIIAENSAGNVGIGTTAPGAGAAWASPALDVSGTRGTAILRTTTTGGISTLRFVGPTAGSDFHINLSDTTGDLSFNPQAGAIGASLNLAKNGNVGIGTTAPGVKFVNSGAANASGPTLGSGTIGANAILSANGLYGLYTGVSSNGDVWQQSQRNDTNTAVYDMLLNPAGGNVGIGTTAPSTKLDVAGSITQTATHGNNMRLWLPAANNGGGTGEVGLYSWISEPGMTWTGGGIARNMYNTTNFPRINTGLSGQMMHFTEAGNIDFVTENTAGTRLTPLSLNLNGTATFAKNLSVNGIAVGPGVVTGNPASAYTNVAIGSQAAPTNAYGTSNVAIGWGAMLSNYDGSGNTAVGGNAGYNNSGSGSLGNGSNNTWIGNMARAQPGVAGYTMFDNSTAIGYDAKVSGSNRVRIGNTAVTQIGGQVGWSALSDVRQKDNIKDYNYGLDFITKLRSVSFTMKDDVTKVPHNGFIAQEVEKTGIPFYGLHKPTSEKDFYTLDYSQFVVPLVNSVKELKAENDKLKADNAALRAETKATTDALLARLEALESRLK